MAISILQTPATCSLAQSPIIFSIVESGPALNSSSFQYVGELYYWTGSQYFGSSSVPDYTLVKFPNSSNAGIFDLNRILNSTLTDLAEENPSNVKYYKMRFYWEYLSGSQYSQSAAIDTTIFKAFDGYGIFPEPIGQDIADKTPHWPLMTDGPVTQSAFLTNRGTSGVFAGDNGGGYIEPNQVYYRSNLGDVQYLISSSIFSSSYEVAQYPIGPSEPGFPLSTNGLEWYSVTPQFFTQSLGESIRYNIVCEQKYPNVRIKWKNRFGQFDYFNFNMINRQGFQTTKRTYQPQLGTWEGSTLSYNQYDSSTLNYISDSSQTVTVNTDWIPETYNDIFKQLLVSDEIYWIYDEAADKLRPITITSSNIQFKTGVVDKLIQYTFDFDWGQAYKLII